ncbi:MAG TPA: hypothetical protein VGR35_15270 [Tepidisphaeraceae bacterium]|nr:hypothetical protein [Tepidisphaeraceae bacterium]
MHWKDIRPPEVRAISPAGASSGNQLPNARRESRTRKKDAAGRPGAGKSKRATISAGRLFFPSAATGAPVKEQPKRARPVKAKEKIDPKFLSAARELRDRYLEHVNGQRVNGSPDALPATSGRYDVSRALPARAAGGKIGHELHESARMIGEDSDSFLGDAKPLPQLPAAA